MTKRDKDKMMEALITTVALLLTEAAVLLLVAVAAGILHVAGHSFWHVFMKGLWLLAAAPAVFLYGFLIERNLYRVNTVEIFCDGLPESFDGYRIAQISDLHLDSFRGRRNSLRRAVKKVNGLGADMVAVTGDLITFRPEEVKGAEDILSGLKAPDGVFSILGNHDYCTYSRMTPRQMDDAVAQLKAAEKALGWNLLLDENKVIERKRIDGNGNAVTDSIYIIGVENISASPKFPSRGDLQKASAGTQGHFRILLSHDPTHWRKEVTGTDIALTLSGHTHSMQFSLLGLWSPSSLIYKEYKGLYRNPDSALGQYLYVNVGLGETGIPARAGARPEITEIILRSGSVAGDGVN